MRSVGKTPGAAMMAAMLLISALDGGRPAAAQGSCDLLCSGDFWEEAGPEDVRRELERGADIMARDKDGATPLYSAAGWSTTPAVLLLLARGADIMTRTELGLTPLHVAAEFSETPAVVALLLECGADPKAKTKSGKTAFDYAKDNEVLKGTDAYWRLNNLSFN